MKTPAVLVGFMISCVGIAAAKDAFTDTFAVEKTDLDSIGTNRFFILAPGYQSVLEGKEGGQHIMLTITVLAETKTVDGVETRVLEEHETADGIPIEISRNYFAISHRTADVFYFGEDVDMYKNGKVVSHEGAWHSGENGAHFGLQMPGTPLLGARYFQEVAPKSAMDRAEVKSLTDTLETTAGKFEHCLRTEESSAIEKGMEQKVYAPGIGLIFDGTLKLTKYGFTKTSIH